MKRRESEKFKTNPPRAEVRDKDYNLWKYFAISFGLVSVILFFILYLLLRLPLLDVFLVIMIGFPYHLVPVRIPFKELPQSPSTAQLILWLEWQALKGIFWDGLIFSVLLLIIVLFGPEEWLEPRPILVIINIYFYFWLKYFYLFFRTRKSI